MKPKTKIFSLAGITAVLTILLLILSIAEKAQAVLSGPQKSRYNEKRQRYKVERIMIESDSTKIKGAK